MSEYTDDERETVAQANNRTLRDYLRLRKSQPHLERSICHLLEKRRRYRRDTRIRVWVMDCGSNGKVYFDDKAEMLMWEEPGDDKLQYHMIWMSGREYGNLTIADWL